MKRLRKAAGIAVIAAATTAGPLLADFTIDQTTQMTGGSLLGMVKVAGAFSSKTKEMLAPTQSNMMISGDRMASVHANRTTIIDLNAETFTEIDNEKRTYSVMTFAQMAEAMNKAMERMNRKGNNNQQLNDVKFKVDVQSTGKSKNLSGMKANEEVIYMTAEATDQKSGQSGVMAVTSDLWLTSAMPGYDEVKEFHRKMAMKMKNYAMASPNLGGLGMMHPELGKGMAEAMEQASKLRGMPVLTITRVGATPDGQPLPPPTTTDAPPPVEGPSAKSQVGGAAADSGARAALGRLGGLGGLMGGGRRKKDDSNGNGSSPNGSGSGAPDPVLLETRTEVTAYNSRPIPASTFSVPAGYQQVESEMAKSAGRNK